MVNRDKKEHCFLVAMSTNMLVLQRKTLSTDYLTSSFCSSSISC